jgi:transposase InsO family protein
MPWKESSVVNERLKFVLRVKDGERVTDLCREVGISRKTAYKFLERFERLGAVGLYDEAPVAERQPHKVKAEVEQLIVAARREHPTWGPLKLRAWLCAKHPANALPAVSTFGRVLSRNKLVEGVRRARPRPAPSTTPTSMAHEPNSVWCCDYKGQFRLGNGRYCYPLTVTDLFSRYLLACEGMDRIDGEAARTAFELLFREYGMPHAMLSDNGPPFATSVPHGLSKLSAWWLRLGIQHQRIEPGDPEQNGAHERMHLTLKRETTRPPGANQLQQQERFDRFRELFNLERPHEALEQKPPRDSLSPLFAGLDLATRRATDCREWPRGGYGLQPRAAGCLSVGDRVCLRRLQEHGKVRLERIVSML